MTNPVRYRALSEKAVDRRPSGEEAFHAENLI